MLTVGIDFARAVFSDDIFPGRKVVTYTSVEITHEDDFVRERDTSQGLAELIIEAVNAFRSIGHCWCIN